MGLDHAVGVGGGLARSGEVAVHEEGVGGVEREGLHVPEVQFPAAGDPELCGWIHETEEAEDLEAALGRKLTAPLQGGSRDRMEEVDRNRCHIEPPKAQGQVDDVLVRLTHPDDPTAAGAEARPPNIINRPHSVVIGVGGADLGIEAPAGVQVVIHALDPRVLEASCLILRHQSKAAADVDMHSLPNLPNNGCQRINIPVAGPPAARHDTIPHRPGRLGSIGTLHELCSGEERILGDGRLRDGRLRAVVTVFRAEATSRIDQHMEVHRASAEVFTDAKGRLEEALKVLRGVAEDPTHLLPARDLSPDRFFCKFLVVHGTHP